MAKGKRKGVPPPCDDEGGSGEKTKTSVNKINKN